MQSISSPSSREAIATEITDRVLQNRPVLKNIIDDQSIKVISGLLDSDRVTKLMTRTISRLQTAITSKNPTPIVLDLTGIKSALTVAASINSRLTNGESAGNTQVSAANIPDKIVLLDVNKLPNIYQSGIILMWLGPLAFIIGLILLAVPIYKTYSHKKFLYKVLFLEGAILITSGLLAYLIGPLFKPALLGQIPSDNMRVVVGNMYNTFLKTFDEQTAFIHLLGFLFLIAGAAVWYFSSRNFKLHR